MYAIVEVGGMQWKVEKDRTIRVPKLDADPGKTVEIKEVLLVVDKDQVNIGQPFVSNATVVATVVDHGKDKKVMVFKKKRRKGYQVKRGHRQDFTVLKIADIAVGKAAPKAAAKKAAPKAEAAATEKKPPVKKAAAPKAAAKKAPAKKAETAEKAKPAAKKAPAKKTETAEKAKPAAKKAAPKKTEAKADAKPKTAAKKAPAKKTAASEEKKEG